MRLIDADHLRKWIIANWGEGWHGKTVDDIIDQIDREHTFFDDADIVDAEPIRHGYWEALYAHEEPTSNVYRCSNCGKGFADYLDDDYDYYNEHPVFFEYDRCPYCGAIMDGDIVYPTYRPDGKYEEFWKNRTVEVKEDEN